MGNIVNPADVILMFDPGHGTREYTAGKRSPDGTLIEGEWAREIVPRLIQECSDLGFGCVNIVPENEDIPRKTRIKRANDIVAKNPGKKCYYISIHLNAAGNAGKWMGATGFSVYVSKTASQGSKDLAKSIYDTAIDLDLCGNRCVPKEHYWQSNFDVIYFTKCPAILTESLFMDNQEECEFLKSEEGKKTIVDLHVLGICRNFGIPCSIVKG